MIEELDVLIRARYPLLCINTHEEMRALRIVTALASTQRHKDKGLYTWSRVRGLARIDGKRPQAIGDQSEDTLAVLELIDNKFESGIFVLFDYHRGLEQDHMVIRRLRELAHSIKSQPKNVIFVSPQFPIPPELEKEVKFIDLPLPSAKDIEVMLDDSLVGLEENPDVSLSVDDRTKEGLVQALLGLTETEIENALAKAVITSRGLGPDSIQLILDEKKDAIRQSGSLTYVHPEPLSSYGGYARHRELIQELALTFTPQAQVYGIEPAKGILAVGLPGVGKDLLKRVTSSIMGKALIDLDMAAVMGEGGGIIGSGAMAIRRALSIAETLSCVLGLSEFEKAVGGLASSNRTDGGETARTLGHLLNWMQDRKGGVFLFATANDVRDLAGEQIREGRFTKIIFVDLPDKQDR
ncbi:MAG: AAA family ATPase, partial [Chloroflexi bacterium]|nr:AAA family ATPase [Chloroflexota bacterium]